MKKFLFFLQLPVEIKYFELGIGINTSSSFTGIYPFPLFVKAKK